MHFKNKLAITCREIDTHYKHMRKQKTYTFKIVHHAFYFYLNRISSRSNGYSIMPVVGTLTLSMSCSVGR